MQYNIGQVLYLVSQKSKQIIPIQVVERVITSTISGDDISYKVMGPKGDLYALNDLKTKGDLYTDIEKMHTELTNKAIKAVDAMVKKSVRIVEAVFKVKTQVEKEPEIDFNHQEDDDIEHITQQSNVQEEIDLKRIEKNAEIDMGLNENGEPLKAKVRNIIYNQGN